MTTMVVPRLAFPPVPHVDRKTVRQLLRYAVVGGLGTVVSALLYLVFRIWWGAVPANLAALVLSTVASTEANRRFTFRSRPVDRAREYLQNAGTVVFYAFYGSAVLVLLGDVVDEPTALQESAAVAAASVLGGLVRFLVLRNWVFAASSHAVRRRPAEWRGAPVPDRPRGAPRPPRGGRPRRVADERRRFLRLRRDAHAGPRRDSHGDVRAGSAGLLGRRG